MGGGRFGDSGMGLQPPRGATDMQHGTRGPAPCPRSVDDDVLHTDRATDPGIFRSQTTPMRQISSVKVMEIWLEVMGHDVTLVVLTCQPRAACRASGPNMGNLQYFGIKSIFF